MNKNIIIGIIILVVILLGGLSFRGGGEESDTDQLGNTQEERYDKVPDFAFEDYEGNIVTPADFPGKALVINSWAVWCPFCVDELPDFGELQEEFNDEIVVIAIDRAESLSKVKEFTDNLGVTDTMVFLLDSDDSFYQSIGGFSMPETLFVDAESNVRIHKRGPMKLPEMIDKVNSILQ